MLWCRESMLLLHLPPYFILWWDVATICLKANFAFSYFFANFAKTETQIGIMKRLSIFCTVLVAMLLVASCADPGKKKAPKRYGWNNEEYGLLYGDIESVIITHYDVTEKFGEIVKKKHYGKKVYNFNPKGDVIENVIYDSDGSLISKILYKYDLLGNMIEKASYHSFFSWTDCRILYKYDSQGNMIEGADYDSSGSLECKYLYKYDLQGDLIEETLYDPDGSLRSKTLYKYDLLGHRIEETIYGSDGLLMRQYIYKYDSQGNIIETVCCNYGALSKWICKYNSHNDIVEKVRCNPNTSLKCQYLYKYDSQGNRIEKIEYEGEIMKPTEMIECEIVYRK